MRPSAMCRFTVAAGVIAAAMTFPPSIGRADETDQYTLPERERFIDIGHHLSNVHCRVLERVVAKTNDDIRQAHRLGSERVRSERLGTLQSPDILADRVRQAFGQGFLEMRLLEDVLYSSRVRNVFDDAVLAYKTPTWIYFYTHLPIDPRKLVLLFQASTVKAFGVYFGTDKFGHFHDLGHIYYKDYRAALLRGMSEEEAVESVVHFFSRGPISEAAVIGFIATGVHSNADLAANYIGMKFYRNLTESMVVGEKQLPPMIVRAGEFWTLNLHVRPDSGFMQPYFSDHWNEALNPSLYELGMRGPIADRIEAQQDEILAFYAHEDGTPRTREEFEAIHTELQTYFGENYGYMGNPNQMVTIANTLFPTDEVSEPSDDAPAGDVMPEGGSPPSGSDEDS